MKIDYNEKEMAALEAYAAGDMEGYKRFEDAFVEELRSAVACGEDHCSCTSACKWHGKCVECVAIHRAHRDHIPACFRDMFNEKLYGLSSLTEHTIIGKIKEKR